VRLLFIVIAGLLGVAIAQQPQGQKPPFKWPFVIYQGCMDGARIHTVEAYYQCQDAYLDRLIAEFEPQTKPGPQLIFSCNFQFAHGRTISKISLETMKAWVDIMHDLGMERVDINPTPTVWIQHDRDSIAKYDNILAYIHQKGMQIAFNPTTFAGEGVNSYEDWKRVACEMYAELARRYHPEIFSVMHEPFTFVWRIGKAPSPAEWRDFTEATVHVIKKESPETKCVTSFLPHEMEVFQTLLKVPSLDGIGFNIFHQYDDFKTFDKMIQMTKNAGKFAYMAETQRTTVALIDGKPEYGDDYGVGNSYLGQMDGKWMKAMTLYALSRRLDGMTIFWSFPLFTYDDEHPNAVNAQYYLNSEKAMLRGQRTAAYAAFRSLIAKYGKPLPQR
jgi:hypothetical protein